MAIQKYKGHLALLGAAIMWGLMSPIGKTALENGISGLSLATFRMTGGAVCFWIASIFAPKEQVKPHDLMMLFFAGLLGIVFNQGCFTFGLSLTSPIDASIVTTTAPIATMIVAAIYLKEPVTGKKVIGIFLGSIGALTLIMSSQGSTDDKAGSIPGDLLCLAAQISFSFYLAIFKGLISRYNIFTLMKWMFTYAAICFIPFSYHEVSAIQFNEISTTTWGCVLFVILGGTFFAYILMMIGQKTLRPTVISMYNYVQPIVGTSVSILLGMGTFGPAKGLAVVLVFSGVYIVTQSKSREQMLAEQTVQKDRH